MFNTRAIEKWTTRRGFSLIELLIALLLVIIISTVFLSLFKRGGLVWQMGEQRVQAYQNARIILSQLSRELPAVYVDDTYNFDGGANNIVFYANIWSGDSSPAAEGLVKLGYKMDEGGEDILDRLYKVDLDGVDPPYREFAFYIKDITFLYDGLSAWDSSEKDNTLPFKVEITLTMADDETYTTAVSIPER